MLPAFMESIDPSALDKGALACAVIRRINNEAAVKCHTSNFLLPALRLGSAKDLLDYVLFIASTNVHTRTAALLLDRGADIHADNDIALRNARGDCVSTVPLTVL
jgi:hypothetical protein